MNTAQVLSLPSPQLALAAITSCGCVGSRPATSRSPSQDVAAAPNRRENGPRLGLPLGPASIGVSRALWGAEQHPQSGGPQASPDTAQFPWGQGPLGRDPALEDTDAVLRG